MTTLAIENITRSGPSRSKRSATAGIGVVPGEKRKPHISAAMTPGTAYGAKSASRKNRCPLRTGESSSSAKTRASPSWSGTEIRKNWATLDRLCQNSESVKTSAYWLNPPQTSWATPKVPSRSTLKNDW